MPKNTAAFRKAKEEYEKYLFSMGVHPSQLKKKRKTFKGIVSRPNTYTSDGIKTSDTILPGCYVRGIMANLDKELPHVRRAILEKASQCTVLYNKGAYGLPTKTDGNILGSRSRRL